MIPGAFEYHRPADLGEAVRLLEEHGDEALLVAGGHSLIPMMKLRMAQPDHLVDLRAINSLKGIRVDGTTVTLAPSAETLVTLSSPTLDATIRPSALSATWSPETLAATVMGQATVRDPEGTWSAELTGDPIRLID